jgi:hypothetical protein
MTSIKMNIDQEWENFMASNNDEDDEDIKCSIDDNDLNENNVYNNLKNNMDEFISANIAMDVKSTAPTASDIYISTKTQISYLNTPIDLKPVFWKIPTIQYYEPKNGVIKKQMKFNSFERIDVENISNKIKDEPYVEEHIITHIDNPDGRIKFKDIRKVSIGISKKDILSYRCKKKSAFYNCFVLIIRIKIETTFKEFHVKVFNTGKLEIPGIKNNDTYDLLLNYVIEILQPHMDLKLFCKSGTTDTVLINSNFNCNFFINRENLFDILTIKYKIQAIYDPCSYPGIQCKFYYNPDVEIKNGCQISEENINIYKNVKKVSFMIFRTGSVLIVGKCDESVLMEIYNFVKILLNNEYTNICQKYSVSDILTMAVKNKNKKSRRKYIMIETTNPVETTNLVMNPVMNPVTNPVMNLVMNPVMNPVMNLVMNPLETTYQDNVINPLLATA